MGSLCLNSLRILVKIRAQKLAQVGMEGSLPGNGKDLSGGGDIFLYGYAGRCLNLMYGVRIAAGGLQGALHLCLICLHRCKVTAQEADRGKGRARITNMPCIILGFIV